MFLVKKYNTFLLFEKVRKKLSEMLGEGEELSYEFEDHSIFQHNRDHQLLLWFNR